MNQANEIEVRSEEVNEILSAVPIWIYRWGIGIIFMLLLIMIGLSYFIRYPDLLTANVTLTTLNPPVKLVVRSTGKISNLFVSNKNEVKSGQVLAVIENTADYKDVILLSNQIEDIYNKLNISDSLHSINVSDSLNVGEITPSYLSVLKLIREVEIQKTLNPSVQKIKLLQKDLFNYQELFNKYKKQGNIGSEQLAIAEADYNRDKALFESKTISAREFENKKKEYLAVLSNAENSKISLSNVLIQINSIEKEILDIQLQNYQIQSSIKGELVQSLKNARSEIQKWKQKYLIESPIDGKISFFSVWAVNQNVEEGSDLFYIVPKTKQEFVGKCILPEANSGKLRLGQKVNIKLDNYPSNEYGLLEATVTSVSEVPNNGTIAIDVSLKNGLKTTYNKTLDYKENMKGKAEIITQNHSVMDRIFQNFRKLVDRS